MKLWSNDVERGRLGFLELHLVGMQRGEEKRFYGEGSGGGGSVVI